MMIPQRAAGDQKNQVGKEAFWLIGAQNALSFIAKRGVRAISQATIAIQRKNGLGRRAWDANVWQKGSSGDGAISQSARGAHARSPELGPRRHYVLRETKRKEPIMSEKKKSRPICRLARILRLRKIMAAGAMAACGLIGSHAAVAALGGPPTLSGIASSDVASEVAANAERMSRQSGMPGSSPAGAAGWTARESVSPEGVKEREYLGADGFVFAVAWRGVRAPDFAALLGGDHAKEMTEKAQALGKQGLASYQGETTQKSATFAARVTSRDGLSAGVAWLPPKLPAGVDPDALGIPAGN